MRPVQDTAGTPSATPIYDALFAEFRKAFRTLPGGNPRSFPVTLSDAVAHLSPHRWARANRLLIR
ncbi:hypothetical protein ACWD4T_51555, partial [Streptomyces umbrinus]